MNKFFLFSLLLIGMQRSLFGSPKRNPMPVQGNDSGRDFTFTSLPFPRAGEPIPPMAIPMPPMGRLPATYPVRTLSYLNCYPVTVKRVDGKCVCYTSGCEDFHADKREYDDPDMYPLAIFESDKVYKRFQDGTKELVTDEELQVISQFSKELYEKRQKEHHYHFPSGDKVFVLHTSKH